MGQVRAGNGPQMRKQFSCLHKSQAPLPQIDNCFNSPKQLNLSAAVMTQLLLTDLFFDSLSAEFHFGCSRLNYCLMHLIYISQTTFLSIFISITYQEHVLCISIMHLSSSLDL
jgi:hypothetical protein